MNKMNSGNLYIFSLKQGWLFGILIVNLITDKRNVNYFTQK